MSDKVDLNDLAAASEALIFPDRGVDALIAATLCGGSVDVDGRYWKPGVRGFSIAPRYTASIDTAMTLVEGKFPADVVRDAMKALATKFGLHMNLWPVDKSYPEWLARFITAAALRARAQGNPDG